MSNTNDLTNSWSVGAVSVALPVYNGNGSETISFTATDPDGLSDSDAATFTVTPVNDPPVADDQSIVTDEDTAKSIVLTASDIEDGTGIRWGTGAVV